MQMINCTTDGKMMSFDWNKIFIPLMLSCTFEELFLSHPVRAFCGGADGSKQVKVGVRLKRQCVKELV